MATTRPITAFFQPVKSSEIENETAVNGVEAEAEAMEFENSERCLMLLFHFLRNVTDCGLDKMHYMLKESSSPFGTKAWIPQSKIPVDPPLQ